MRTLSLAITDGAGGRTVAVDQFPATVGRDVKCRVRIDAPSVSMLHCALHRVGDRFFVMDNRSSNGTVLNGRKVAPCCLKVLQGGDRVQLGSVQVAVSVASAAATGGTRTRFRELLGSADLSEAGAGAFVVILNGPDAARSLALEGGMSCDAGRDAGSGLCIPDRQISSRHFRLTHRGGSWTVEDRKSRNGTFLNGTRTRGFMPLKDGDVICAGGTRIMFVSSGSKEVPPAAAGVPHDTRASHRSAAIRCLFAAVAGLGSLGAAVAIMYCIFS